MNKPFVSIILCTYNGEKNIAEAIESLIKQTYPSDRYEVILVNDGSKDQTATIISKYNIKTVNLMPNRGLAAARNAGLNTAKGEIIVTFDDDCIATPEWLENLIGPYDDINVMAVGGLSKSYTKKNIMERYMHYINYGNPTIIRASTNKSILNRLTNYIKTMLQDSSANKVSTDTKEVDEIYTMNASFRKSCLDGINGWDNSLKASEDSDLSLRLKKKYKSFKILFEPKALIYHKHRTSISKFVRQHYYRGMYIGQFYNKSEKTPPIFPFPIIWAVSSIVYFLYQPLISPIVFLALPQTLYLWWPIKSFKKSIPEMLLYPYIQLSIELATILGILKYYLFKRHK